MRDSLERTWGWVFVGLVQLPIAGLVGALLGRFDLAVWAMGIASHHVARSGSVLSTGRRVFIWVFGVTCGALAAVVGQGLTPDVGPFSLGTVVAVRLALEWLPVAAAWGAAKAVVPHLVGTRPVPVRPVNQAR